MGCQIPAPLRVAIPHTSLPKPLLAESYHNLSRDQVALVAQEACRLHAAMIKWATGAGGHSMRRAVGAWTWTTA